MTRYATSASPTATYFVSAISRGAGMAPPPVNHPLCTSASPPVAGDEGTYCPLRDSACGRVRNANWPGAWRTVPGLAYPPGPGAD